MKEPAFRSSLAEAMCDLVAFKRIEGFDYGSQVKVLQRFDTFLWRHGYDRTVLDRKIVDAYIESMADLTANGRYTKLSIVRVLSRYLHSLDPESYVLHGLPLSRPTLPRWYLYSPEDISRLLRQAMTLGPAGSLRAQGFRILIGLLYVTGLRIGEALALNLGDVDVDRRLMRVRRGKFNKERYVALHPSAIDVIEEYLAERTACGPSGDRSPFFLNTAGRRFCYKSVAKTFSKMVRRCGIGHSAPQPPRLHDLRHTYACNCVLKWYEEGAGVNRKLPALATAMGHVNIGATQVYLHVSSRLLHEAVRRLHSTFTAGCNGG